MLRTFSLIIATLGRKHEVHELLSSISQADYDNNAIEVILVDQNKDGYLNDIIAAFDDLNIKHIRSELKGLSRNRNIGLRYATGDIICYPDDDCKYYENTFNKVLHAISNHDVDFCIGRIYDRESRKNIMKIWPKRKIQITKFRSYFLNSSITMFIRKEIAVFFNENLGAGEKFGSCEDAEMIYRILHNNAKGIYCPTIEVWHPEPNSKQIPLDKVRNYASGFGYFVSNGTDKVKATMLLLLISKKIYQLFVNPFTRQFQDGYFTAYFSGLLYGVLSSRQNDEQYNK